MLSARSKSRSHPIYAQTSVSASEINACHPDADSVGAEMRTEPLHGLSEHASVGSVDFGDQPAWHCDAGNPSDDGVHAFDAAMHALSVACAESEQVPPNPFCTHRDTFRIDQ